MPNPNKLEYLISNTSRERLTAKVNDGKLILTQETKGTFPDFPLTRVIELNQEEVEQLKVILEKE